MAIVYTHTRNDNGNIFYVGIGLNEKRAYEKVRNRRNDHWHRIVNKHGYTVNITHTDIVWEEACKIEQYLISFWRDVLGKKALSNITDGGEGSAGLIMSDEAKLKMRNKELGTKQSDETRKKHSETMKKVVRSTDFREKVRQASLGRTHNEESRKKISIARTGAGNGKARKVINTVTGEIHDTLKAAALSIGMPVGTLQHQLSGYCKNRTNFRIFTT